MAFPLAVALDFSFRAGRFMTFAGSEDAPRVLDHYARAFADAETWRALWRSVVYTVGTTIPALLIGLGLALLLNQHIYGRRWLRTAALLPWALPAVSVVIVFTWMMDQAFGVVNWALRGVGLITANVSWFFNPETAMLAVIVPTVWKGYPFFTLIILAALQTVPHDLYEAARIDGANRLQQFFYVTLPHIMAPVLLATVLTVLWVFREYDFIYATTQGGPNRATETLAIAIYNQAFRFFDFGYAAALGILASLVTGAVVLMFASRLAQQPR